MDKSAHIRKREAILIDHECLDISRIPSKWLEEARTMKLHYAHTSHGSQLLLGLKMLQKSNPKYPFVVREKALPQMKGTLAIFDGQETETYITPDKYWASPAGLAATAAVLEHNRDTNVSMWSWCTQLNHYSAAETQRYLEAISHLEKKYPHVTFVYMTGNAQAWRGHHTYKSDAEGYNRHLRNQQIREYCREHGKVLFDFADIDCWYNGGQAT